MGVNVHQARKNGAIRETHGIQKIGCVARKTGDAPGGVHQHRQAAFDAAHQGINRLKRLVPIWKKEYFVDGEVWVEGEWDRSAPLASHP